MPLLLRRLLLLQLGCRVATVLSVTTIHVSPERSSAATTPDGSADRPFAGPHEARDAMRAGLGHGGPRTVLIEGTHFLGQPLQLDSRDTGSAEAPVTWRSRFAHAPARLSGGVRLPSSAFHPATVPSGAAGVLKINLFEHGFNVSMLPPLKAVPDQGSGFLTGAPELFVDGQIMLRARSPNVAPDHSWVYAGYNNMSGPTLNASWAEHSNDSFIFTDASLAPLWRQAAQNSADLWLHGYFQWDWRDTFVRVSSIERTAGNAWNVTRAPDTPPGPDSQFTKGSRFYALAALELLDSPGEYHINSTTGEMWLLPTRPLLPSTELVVSVLDTVVNAQDVSHHTFADLRISDARQSLLILAGTQTLGSNAVHNCTMVNAGGLCVAAAGNNNTLSGNTISGCGKGGVNIFAGMPTKALVAGNASLVGNRITNVSRIARTYNPAASISGDGNYVGHNYFAHTPHTAYMQGGCDNLYEHNTMVHACFETADASGFYVGRSWVQQGNVVRNNVFRDIHATTRLGAVAAGAPCCQQVAFYLDDEISGFDFYGNTVVNAGLGVLLGGGRRNRIHANNFTNCEFDIHFDNRGMEPTNTRCRANCTGGPSSCFKAQLEAVHYQQPPWSVRFPELVNIFESGDPCMPMDNDISDNTYCHQGSSNRTGPLGFTNVDEETVKSWMSTISNNRWSCSVSDLR